MELRIKRNLKRIGFNRTSWNLLMVLLISISSCKNLQSIEFKKISNARFQGVEKGNLLVHADAVFFNPNNMQGKVKELEITISINDQEIGKLKEQLKKAKIFKQSEFKIPLIIHLSTKNAPKDLLKRLFEVVIKRYVNIHYQGYIKLKKAFYTRKIEIDYYDEIELR